MPSSCSTWSTGIRYWDQSAQRIYGWSAGEVLGKSIRELLSGDPASFDQAMARFCKTMDGGVNWKTRPKTNVRLTLHCRWTLVRDGAGRPQSVLAINTDATARKKMETQFLRAQRLESIGTLAGGIAHDLNNILAPVMMAIERKRYGGCILCKRAAVRVKWWNEE